MQDDFYPGDPALHVMGRSEEKSARRHAPQPPKPKTTPSPFEERTLRNIRARKAEIQFAVDETPRLMQALEALEPFTTRKGKK